MSGAPRRSVSIAAEHNQATLSNGQKAFNKLITQIEKRRNRLIAWEAAEIEFQRKYVDKMLPLVEVSMDLEIRLLHRLDDAYDQKGVTKAERQMISELITSLAGDLLEERDDAALKAVYNRHSESDYDSEIAAGLDDMKAVLETVLGVELGDDLDMNSPEEVIQRAHAKMAEQEAREAAEHESRQAHRAKRQKSAKQRAAQARQEEDQAQSRLSVREIYRKLASALHPDREPDPHERERKTALMQRVNKAYENNNLLLLLELQLELEHIDQSAINDISEDRLKHYNRILKEQLGELDQEVLHVETRFRASYGIPLFTRISPETVVRSLSGDIVKLQQSIRDREANLRMFGDLKNLKVWLKDLKRQQAERRFDDMAF